MAENSTRSQSANEQWVQQEAKYQNEINSLKQQVESLQRRSNSVNKTVQESTILLKDLESLKALLQKQQ